MLARLVLMQWLESLGQLGQLLAESTYYILRGELEVRQTVRQMLLLGVHSLPIVLVISGFTGMVFSLQVAQEFERFGAAPLIGQLLALAVVRELGPVLTGVVVAGRAGSAMAAEIGTMKATEQVDALRALATSPIQYLVVPRILACVIMLPVLTVFANGIGMIGGYVVAVWQVGVLPQVFFESATAFLGLYDFGCSMLKAVVFGLVVAVFACHRGLQQNAGAEGVGGATISAVVTGMIGVFITNYFLTAVLFR